MVFRFTFERISPPSCISFNGLLYMLYSVHQLRYLRRFMGLQKEYYIFSLQNQKGSLQFYSNSLRDGPFKVVYYKFKVYLLFSKNNDIYIFFNIKRIYKSDPISTLACSEFFQNLRIFFLFLRKKGQM